MPKFANATESVPLILVHEVEVLKKVLDKEHLDEEENYERDSAYLGP